VKARDFNENRLSRIRTAESIARLNQFLLKSRAFKTAGIKQFFISFGVPLRHAHAFLFYYVFNIQLAFIPPYD
jgi:hypothetical protein